MTLSTFAGFDFSRVFCLFVCFVVVAVVAICCCCCWVFVAVVVVIVAVGIVVVPSAFPFCEVMTNIYQTVACHSVSSLTEREREQGDEAELCKVDG